MIRQILPKFSYNSPQRTFVFDNQTNYSSLSIEEQIDSSGPSVDLKSAIARFQRLKGDKQQYSYKIFDPNTSNYLPIPENKVLSSQFFMTPTIMMKYSKAVAESDTESSSSMLSTESRKQRNKERSIREVIESVKRWRDIHNSFDSDGNKVSLQQAAKVIGISKKSLDDYFYQLRLGEQFGFDFEKHMDSKIGALRAFVKKHKPTKETLRDKHPRRLKIIEDLGLQNTIVQQLDQIRLDNTEAMDEEPKVVQMEDQQNIPDLSFPQPQKILAESERQFYESFEFEDPDDLFVTFKQKDFIGADFQKKSSGFQGFDLMPW